MYSEDRNPDVVVDRIPRKSAEIAGSLIKHIVNEDSSEESTGDLRISETSTKTLKSSIKEIEVYVSDSPDTSFDQNELKIDENSPFVNETDSEMPIENVAKNWFDINQG